MTVSLSWGAPSGSQIYLNHFRSSEMTISNCNIAMDCKVTRACLLLVLQKALEETEFLLITISWLFWFFDATYPALDCKRGGVPHNSKAKHAERNVRNLPVNILGNGSIMEHWLIVFISSWHVWDAHMMLDLQDICTREAHTQNYRPQQRICLDHLLLPRRQLHRR